MYEGLIDKKKKNIWNWLQKREYIYNIYILLNTLLPTFLSLVYTAKHMESITLYRRPNPNPPRSLRQMHSGEWAYSEQIYSTEINMVRTARSYQHSTVVFLSTPSFSPLKKLFCWDQDDENTAHSYQHLFYQHCGPHVNPAPLPCSYCSVSKLILLRSG